MLKIKTIESGGIGEELGLTSGDIIISLNQCSARDVLDYFYHMAGEEVTVRVKTSQGNLVEYSIEKDYDEDLGLEFEIKARRCRNKCVFCFIDQQPPKMRSTLYIKDDDYRLSFLHGNYITLTNLAQRDIERITREKISPLYISIHSTDPHVRAELSGGQVFDLKGTLIRLRDAGIEFHGQIVLCPGYNDGTNLANTLKDLSQLGSALLSLAVVPVGLTRYREKLTPLRPVDKVVGQEVIELTAEFQQRFLKEQGRRTVFAADEFFVKAELPAPPTEYYEDFSQLENGIGLIRQALNQAAEVAQGSTTASTPKRGLLLTGKAAVGTMSIVAQSWARVFPNLTLTVRSVENQFLGKQITVAGLLAGADILDFAETFNEDWDFLLVPGVAVRAGCFIDDYSTQQLSQKLDKPVYAPENILELAEKIRNEVLA